MISKNPGRFAIAIALNFILVFLAALLLFYRYPAQLDGDALAYFDSRYENCAILSAAADDEMIYYLVQTQSGETDLIPVKLHVLFLSKAKICKGQITVIEDPNADVTLTPTIDFQSNTVTLSSGQIQNVRSAILMQKNADLTAYLLVSIVLSLLELFLLDKIRGN